MAPPASSPQQQGDNSLAPFWITIGLFALAWVIWTVAHVQIASFILKLRLLEVDLIRMFVPSAQNLATVISNSSPADMSFRDLAGISNSVGKYLRYPAVIILAVLAVAIYVSNPNLRYKKTYSMQMLVDEEKVNWPQIMPVANLDLVNTNIFEGPWAMSEAPMQFAKKHQLLQEEHVVSSDTAVYVKDKTIVTVQRDLAYQVFAIQVGRYWTGIEHLNKHTRALFAVFAARAAHDRDGAQQLLMQIATSTAGGKLDFSGTDALLEKHKNNKDVVKVTQSHAFVLTVMASMLKLARTDGVLATADFIWLKPIDRALWYMLNSVGRQTAFPEASGPFAHWLAECALDRKLSVPMVDEAVIALEIAIKDILYVPDKDET